MTTDQTTTNANDLPTVDRPSPPWCELKPGAIPGGVEDIFDAGREYQRRLAAHGLGRWLRETPEGRALMTTTDSKRGPRAWLRRFSSSKVTDVTEPKANAARPKNRQTTCPDWCQSKPHDDNPDGGFDGPHTWPSIPSLYGDDPEDYDYDNTTLISVTTDESVIGLIASNLPLTLKQARSVALALHTVADWAEEQEPATS